MLLQIHKALNTMKMNLDQLYGYLIQMHEFEQSLPFKSWNYRHKKKERLACLYKRKVEEISSFLLEYIIPKELKTPNVTFGKLHVIGLHSSFYLVWSILNRYSYTIWDNCI